MRERTVIFGNYLCGGCACVEEDLTLEKIHRIINHWFINQRTGELYKASNKTQMVFLENNLVLFYHTAEDCVDEGAKQIPHLIFEDHSIFGIYIIARYENGDFVDLTKEDILRLEKSKQEIDEMRMKEIEKCRIERENK